MATEKKTLKQWFSNFKKPTQEQFWAWLDSFWHKSEEIPMATIEGLESALEKVATSEQLNNHVSDLQAHSDLFNGKVDKETGKGLSSNDFTEAYKQKIDNFQLPDLTPYLLNGGYSGTGQDLKNAIDLINAVLQSDDSTLDDLQEIVNYIKMNKSDLQNLSIDNIAGLVDALLNKANKIHRHNWEEIDGTESVATKEDINNLRIGGENLISGGRHFVRNGENMAIFSEIFHGGLTTGETYILSADEIKGGEILKFSVSSSQSYWGAPHQSIQIGVPFIANNNHTYLWVSGNENREIEYKNVTLQKGNKATTFVPDYKEYAQTSHNHSWNDIQDKPTDLATTEDITQAVGDLKIGGRNLLRKTKEFSVEGVEYGILLNYAGDNGVASETFNGNVVRKINSTYQGYGANIPRIFGEPIIISFWAKSEGAAKFGNFAFNVDPDSIGSFTQLSNNGNIIGDNQWHRYYIFNPKGMVFGMGNLNGFVEFYEFTSEILISSIKIEKGNKATDWSPAPEDIINEFNTRVLKTSSNISTSQSISNYSQHGRNIVTTGTANLVVTIDSEDGFSATYQKGGAGSITFQAGTGKTLVQVDGTNIVNGVKGSTATVTVVGNEILLRIANA